MSRSSPDLVSRKNRLNQPRAAAGLSRQTHRTYENLADTVAYSPVSLRRKWVVCVTLYRGKPAWERGRMVGYTGMGASRFVAEKLNWTETWNRGFVEFQLSVERFWLSEICDHHHHC